jgi:hypothetical protein
MDYESEDGSVEPLSEGLATTGTVHMAAPSTTQDPPPDPNATCNNANANGGASEDFLWTPITTNVISETLETIHLSLQAEQERQLAERERLRLSTIATHAVSLYRNRQASCLQLIASAAVIQH